MVALKGGGAPREKSHVEGRDRKVPFFSPWTRPTGAGEGSELLRKRTIGAEGGALSVREWPEKGRTALQENFSGAGEDKPGGRLEGGDGDKLKGRRIPARFQSAGTIRPDMGLGSTARGHHGVKICRG